MTQREIAQRIIESRRWLAPGRAGLTRKAESEGGCGVIGIASSEQLPARHLLRALEQMRNRGNGKGGGIAAAGLDHNQLGVKEEILRRDYLLTIAYLDPDARAEVEGRHIEPNFEVDCVRHIQNGHTELQVQPPIVYQYFVRVKPNLVEEFKRKNGLNGVEPHKIEDEIVYQSSYRLNRAFYAATGQKRAFVLSHGKDMLVLKMVGYGDDVIRHYGIEGLRAHIWIGHHRYPTKGKVWHPGGAHPFIGMHEALVHNGDFANYASICEYLAQRNIYPLFLTDTEVAALTFDLLHRIYGYKLEYVIESLAPTTERDFALLPEGKRQIYQMLQEVHIHGSPDGPWFFLIAQSLQDETVPTYRLIGITDTSMLRPQVFALQGWGDLAIGLAASEKQAIDAALESLAAEDLRFCARADRYWNARGGSHTDGGAFIFTIRPDAFGRMRLACSDKFGRAITIDQRREPCGAKAILRRPAIRVPDSAAAQIFEWAREQMARWDYADLTSFLEAMAQLDDRRRAIQALTLLMDRRYHAGKLRPSSLLSLLDRGLSAIFESIRRSPSSDFAHASADEPSPQPQGPDQTLVIDARGFAPEGPASLALEIVRMYKRGFRKFIVAHARGHRFIANGLGPDSKGVRIDVYGSSGDYLASGIDGAEVYVHGSAQDQVAQIMKDGKLVIYGDVGQVFMYAAKGGEAYVLGSAAGRPLINAVGKPRVVINGTCLDYLAESFMAGEPLGGGFVILNAIRFDDDSNIVELEEPYPGGNLFSLASGGAIYIRDPHGKVSEEQLNGGEFAEFTHDDWAIIRPYLEENERLFGIPVARLLEVDGRSLPPESVYRKIKPGAVRALGAEEAWVKKEA
jgi:glutamate synthase domain-containing protein 1/glutamate synthase domain-containing protein 3